MPNLYKKYASTSKDTWAVITGGSDGIGLQFCKDLAIQGFNICIIARNEEKMKEKLIELQNYAGSQIKTRYVIADLAKLTHMSEYEEIANQLKDIDIGMLILNAGWNHMGPFLNLTPTELEQIITINTLHPAYLIKALSNQIMARSIRSAIIIISSGYAAFPASGNSAYSSSKMFSSYFGQCLNYELQNQVDVLSFECGYVSTKLLRQKPSLFVLKVADTTTGCLRDIGREFMTYGPLMHELVIAVVSWLPVRVNQRRCYKKSVYVDKRLREKEKITQKQE